MEKRHLRIASPCTVDWERMTPADRGRFCGDCKKVVRDLSRMTEREATELVRGARAGELCVRYVYDRRGKVFFAPSPDLFLARAKRAGAAAAAVMALTGCNAILHEESEGTPVMGDVAYMPEQDLGDAAPDAAPDADARADAPHDDGAAADAGADAPDDADRDAEPAR